MGGGRAHLVMRSNGFIMYGSRRHSPGLKGSHSMGRCAWSDSATSGSSRFTFRFDDGVTSQYVAGAFARRDDAAGAAAAAPPASEGDSDSSSGLGAAADFLPGRVRLRVGFSSKTSVSKAYCCSMMS